MNSNNNNNMPRIFWGNRPLSLDDLQNKLKPKHLLQNPITLENGQPLPLDMMRQILGLPPEALGLVEAMTDVSSSDFLDLAQTVREFGKMDNGDAEFAFFLKYIDALSEDEVAKLEEEELLQQGGQQLDQDEQPVQQQLQPEQQMFNNNITNQNMNQNSFMMNNMMMMMTNNNNNSYMQQMQQNQLQMPDPEQMQAQLQMQTFFNSSSNLPFASI